MRLKIITYAKVNLYLDVVGKYPNGYHQIESIFQNVSLYDELVLEDSCDGLCFSTNDKSLPTDRRNLVIKAVELLKNTFKINRGINIHLHKSIPIGSGLGGGSSNCAGALAGLNLVWNLGLSNDDLIKFARLLGADVPFFLIGGTCAVGGIGDIVNKLPFSGGYYIVLIYPGLSSSTAEVYRHNSLSIRRVRKGIEYYSYNFRKVLLELARKNWKRVLYNRLEKPAFNLYPQIAKIKDNIKKKIKK